MESAQKRKQKKTKKKDHNCIEYQCWKESHGENCHINWEKFSPAMEAEGAVVMWQRSAETHSMRYMKFVGDGESKSYDSVLEAKPFGVEPENQVGKLDCVGHVQKRMGTGLRALVNKSRGQKLVNGRRLQGKGRVTKKRTDDYQTYYGKAIPNNMNYVERMQKPSLAIVYHSASTTQQPQHQYQYYPVGATSWCHWQRDPIYQPPYSRIQYCSINI